MNSHIGSELKAIIRSYGISPCQACIDTANKMDRMSTESILENIDLLANELHKNASKHPKLFAKLLDDVSYAVFGLKKYKELIQKAIKLANEPKLSKSFSTILDEKSIHSIKLEDELGRKLDELGPATARREVDSLYEFARELSSFPAKLQEKYFGESRYFWYIIHATIDHFEGAAVQTYQFPEEPMKKGRRLREERIRKLSPHETTKALPIEDILREISQPVKIREKGWNFRPEVIEAHRIYFQLQRAIKYTYPEDKFSGRGIVILGGGKYFTSAYILIRLLRELGCKLPIELWCLNDSEYDYEMLKLVDAEVVNARDRIEEVPRCFGGWQAKIWAIIYSKFEEVLFLDADQIPTRDPEYIFDSTEYQQTGAIFWQDIRNHLGLDITAQSFETLMLPIPAAISHTKPTEYAPFESGQILLNKRKHWDTIQFCKVLNDHSDFWYPEPRGRAMWHIYGDKSTFCLAWQDKPHHIQPEPAWGGVRGNGAFMQCDTTGNVLFQHKCQPPEKYQYGRDYSRRHAPGILHQEKIDQYLLDLRKSWNGKIWDSLRIDNSCVGEYFTQDNEKVELLWDGKLDGGFWGFYKDHLVVKRNNYVTVYFQDDFKTFVRNYKNGKIDYLVAQPTIRFEIPPNDAFAVGTWNSIYRGNEYKLPEVFPAGSEVVDIGGHIGSFSTTCLLRGASKVQAFEPDKMNYEYLKRNLGKYPDKAEFFNYAILGYDRPLNRVGFGHPVGAKHSAGGSITDITEVEYEVLACGWKQIEGILPKRIFLLKLDCEGSEWSILRECKLDNVLNICGEYHLAHNKESVESLKSLLFENSYILPHPRVNTLGLFWTWRNECPFVLP